MGFLPENKNCMEKIIWFSAYRNLEFSEGLKTAPFLMLRISTLTAKEKARELYRC